MILRNFQGCWDSFEKIVFAKSHDNLLIIEISEKHAILVDHF